MKPTKVHGVDGAASPPRPTIGAAPTGRPTSGTTPAATAPSPATPDDGAATTTTGADAPTTPAGATTFAAYLDALRARFAGKDPRRLKGAVAKTGARVVLVLKEGADVRRATIVVGGGRARVDVVEGPPRVDDAPTAFVFATFDDWHAFFERADADRAPRIDFFGDASVLALLPELAAQTSSPLFTRLAAQT